MQIGESYRTRNQLKDMQVFMLSAERMLLLWQSWLTDYITDIIKGDFFYQKIY